MLRVGIIVSALVVAAGCNHVLGLGATDLETHDAGPATDDDHDDVRDDQDNCPTIANADQADRDDDGIGDACDGCDGCAACPVGPAHDEDGDRLADGCDNCPAQANPGQGNADGDDLGDACDASATTAQRRVFFDGFGALSADWAGNTLWIARDDAAMPQPGQIPTFDGFRLANRAVMLGAGAFTVEVALELPAPRPPAGAFVGYRLVPATGSAFWFCAFGTQAEGWTVTNGVAAATAATGTVVLRNRGDGAATSEQNACEVPGEARVTITSSNGPRPWSPQLWATVDAAYRYVEIVQ